MHKDAIKRKHRPHHHAALSSDVEKIKAALADASYEMKGMTDEWLNESLHGVKAQSAKMQDNLSHYVAKKPFQALGFALLTGIVLGFLLRK